MTAHSALVPGERVAVLVEKDGGREAVRATVRRHEGNTIELALADRFPRDAGRAIVLIGGEGSEQRFLGVAQSAPTAHSLMLLTDGRWRMVFDRRGAPRFPTLLPVALRTGGTIVTGRCIEISLGGASLEVGAWLETHFTVEFRGRNEPVLVPAEMKSAEHVMGNTVIHARFGRLSPEAREVIESLVASAREEFESAQRFIGLRVDDPAPADLRHSA